MTDLRDQLQATLGSAYILEQLLSIPSNVSVALLRVDPWFDPHRKDARFLKLVAAK